ncbi:MAG TPA: transcriptional repressor [Solirubrobacteraceae bacterium]|jgi:Fur family ferric uptake transcriptional regulator|nr:transcriptional repressor [Solirubrobacteraceae bacterium]
MTVIRDAGPPLPAPTLDAAIAAVRARGLRLSAARRLVLEALFAAGGPITAERLASGIDGDLPPSDLASVYRNLEMLEAVGLVRHVHMGHGPGRYALAGAHAAEYVSCDGCGAYQRLAPEALDGVRAAVHEACGYEARFTHFPVVGLCPRCAGEDR